MEFFCPGSGGYCTLLAEPQYGGYQFSLNVSAGSSVKKTIYPSMPERVYNMKCYINFVSSTDYFESPYFIEHRYEGELSDFSQGVKTAIKPGVSRLSMEIDPSMGPITLATISVTNPHHILRNVVDPNQRVDGSFIREMVIPFVANATHIIGIDILNSDFMHHWTWAKRYGSSFNESYMYISMRPLKKFTISYIIMAKKSVSFHDAAEQWHKTFPEIYDMVEYEAGSYAPQPYMTKWAGKEDELINTFLGRFQTGTFSGDKLENVSYFKRVSPTYVYANYANNADFDSNCVETDTNCTLIKNNPIINSDGNRVIFSNTASSSKLPLVPPQSVLDVTMSEYNENIDKWSYNGAHLDYTNMRIANYDLTHAEEFTPYTLIDTTNGKECYNMVMTMFPLVKKLVQKSPKGIMISMTNVPP
ncbi:hypothetical protein TVAG_392350 [Trichomonas vaginalis G3]|uniref:Uncharacterized protein n=1 Tax=Trichomonas vaginalis (strain ATCC PRA-98 / G3) TaxID=412133 RepID=A2DWT6_TRIV3|nr:spectrin binding [Trichomonas vaginalis G3]EAY15118.1 hypothetical protein TVAG_392350 [Trichomonas vaginalis G3]KAI5499190.1 spectrin binding [Trichomonas vaginalis G3]|eukprot:XP_001327341.1 hypothetical protein [Trichomonas vaginalis G3]